MPRKLSKTHYSVYYWWIPPFPTMKPNWMLGPVCGTKQRAEQFKKHFEQKGLKSKIVISGKG